MSAGSALARQTLRDARTRTISFALLFALGAGVQGSAYRAAYPNLQDRLQLERSFGANRAVRLLYGVPHDLLTVGGYMSWRLGAFAIFAGLWGVLAAVRALRAEEDAGRRELVLSGPVSRADVLRGALAGIAMGAAIVWLALLVGILAGRAGAGPSVFLSIALVSPLPVFVGVGAVASQIAPTRRMAMGMASAVLAVALLVRMVADTSSAGWLRWATPLGWAEELRPFAGARPVVLLLPALATLALLLVAARIERRRDIGQGLLAAHDSSPPRLSLLSSPTALALRTQWGGLLAWLLGIGAFSLIMGVISDSVVSGLSQSVQDLLKKLGTAATTPSGYLGFAFQYLLLALTLFACFQLAAMRDDETEQRLETLFALPVRRARWFARAAAAGGRGRRRAGAGGRRAGVGRRGLAGRRRLVGAHDRGGRQLPAGHRAVPGPRGARPRPGPASGDDDRLRARRGGLPVGDDRRADRGARLGARPLPLPPRRPRARRVVPGRRRRGDARDRGARRPGGARCFEGRDLAGA